MTKRILILLYLLTLALPLFAQVQLGVPLVKSQYFDNNGHVLSGGCIFTYVSGTNTPLATYTDFTGLVANPNPVVLQANGRPQNDIWLRGQAYRVKLVSSGGVNCASGFTIWVEDGINVGAASLLASNNIWTGTNTWQNTSTFNGSVTMNTGFTSNGPSNLTAGGSLAGTFTGSPTFSGTLNLSGGFMTTTGTFSGQIIDTIATGTPPFVVTSTTLVPHLNVNLLDGCDWAVPCPLGSTTPNTIVGTTVKANTSLTIGAAAPLTSVQGAGDTALLAAGSFTAGAGRALCTDANGGATTAACAGSSFSQVQGLKKIGGLCTNASGTNNACTDVLTWPVPFVDANYIVTCTGVDANAFLGQSTTNEDPVLTINSYTNINVTVINQNQRGGQPATYTEVHCIGIHP